MGVAVKRAAIISLGLCACIQTEELHIGEKKLREPCTTTAECVPGLVCDHELCVPILEQRRGYGEQCGPQLACIEGFCCGADGYCREVREEFQEGRCGFGPGDHCFFDVDCDVTLDCRIDGVCVEDALSGPGEPCSTAFDCRAPLVCGPTGLCDTLPFSFGATCALPEEELGPFRPYYETDGTNDFYRLPFPNDLRVIGGKIDLSKHPSPGVIFGYDASELFFDPITRDADGFSLIAPIFFRFSDLPSFDSLAIVDPARSVELINIDPDSPSFGREIEADVSFRTGRGRFICENTLSVAPTPGHALEPRTTYAVLLRGTITSSRSGTFAGIDRDLDDLLKEEQPDANAPLRNFVELREIDNLVGATVFTTGDPGAIMPLIRAAVRAPDAPAPQITELVDCEHQTPHAPCECAEENGSHRFAGSVALPVLQTGTRPYLQPADGGTIPRHDGAVRVYGMESVCFALMVPTSTASMPAAGWPIVLYSHGTGGSYLTSTTTIAGDLTADPTPLVVLTYEAVMHGSRRGSSSQAPELLFFNLLNPPAARDNVLQGAADLFALTAMIERQAKIGSTPIDPTRIMFYGHSQGSVVGVPFLRHESGVYAAVLSGAGADLGLSLVSKTSPLDIAAVVYALTGARDRFDPIVGLIDLLFGPADAITYARDLVRGRSTPLHLLMTYGANDTYVPEASQQALITAMDIPFVGSMPEAISGFQWTASPARATVGEATAGVAEFVPPDGAYDGHFVATRDPAAKRMIARFLKSAAEGDPVIER